MLCYHIGFGIFANKKIEKGSFICEYRGKILSKKEGEEIYQNDLYGGNFLYFFAHEGKNYW